VENVEFCGQSNDVSKIWAENHGLVLPSRYEGLPLVIVEAMFCGRMVITTDIAGNTEYLSEGISGFIAQAPTWELLDEAMEIAWARRSRWREMGVNARQHALAELPADPIGVFAQKLVECVTTRAADESNREALVR
jgi:glycosyltransferase involved in cell wall biosynthesis